MKIMPTDAYNVFTAFDNADLFVNELTPEQKKLVGEYKKQWLKKAFEKHPFDKEEIVYAVNELYKAAEYDPPEKVLFAKSPKEAVYLSNRMHDEYLSLKIKDSIKKDTRNFFLRKMTAGVEKYLKFNLMVQPLRKLEPIREYVNQLFENTTVSLSHQKTYFIYASLWSNRSAYISFIRDVLKLYPRFNTTPFERLSELVSGMVVKQNVCIVVEKPELKYDKNFNLHSLDGPAIKYGDDFAYFINGVRIPDKYIENNKIKKLTVSDLLAINNMNLRYALALTVDKQEILKSNMVSKEKRKQKIYIPELSLKNKFFYIESQNNCELSI